MKRSLILTAAMFLIISLVILALPELSVQAPEGQERRISMQKDALSYLFSFALIGLVLVVSVLVLKSQRKNRVCEMAREALRMSAITWQFVNSEKYADKGMMVTLKHYKWNQSTTFYVDRRHHDIEMFHGLRASDFVEFEAMTEDLKKPLADQLCGHLRIRRVKRGFQ